MSMETGACPSPPDSLTPKTAALCRAISAGMTATAEIKTDQRRIVDHVLSLISRATSEAGRGR
ncbi:hypothetical protein KCG44_11485 [Pacificimonas sp. WHA3]|uniref:Uncharacterized protein n=1 Tax=Pacificimonas pallii TaxID=2827236 RepID=A0ABS6SG62_9SPHN|nr:hypothetical protein [Pacificimonas pallii]MBV7257407.1 hypothetical protein [Pacificimonas pallii]